MTFKGNIPALLLQEEDNMIVLTKSKIVISTTYNFMVYQELIPLV